MPTVIPVKMLGSVAGSTIFQKIPACSMYAR
jgi:hypothetical protein